MKNEKSRCKYMQRLFDGWKTGLEPATSGTTIRRSNLLSYNHHFYQLKNTRSLKKVPQFCALFQKRDKDTGVFSFRQAFDKKSR